jgi:hypothetical protein
MAQNPYEAPQSDGDAVSVVASEGMDRIISGQRLLVFSILAGLAGGGLRVAVGPAGIVVSVAAAVMALVGMFRMGVGMGYSRAMRILLMVAMVVPLVSFVTMLVVSSLATRRLRAAGYKVGLLGVSR